MLNVLIADDHEIVREALRAHVERLATSVQISEVATYAGVVACLNRDAATTPPDLIILDLQMPDQPSATATDGLRQILSISPHSRVVIFSACDDPATILSTLKCGARGYIPKSTTGRSLVAALKFVLNGEIYVPPAMMNEAVTAALSKPDQGGLSSALQQLSARELTGLRLLTQGKTNKQIAREMGLQDVTVKMHLRNAYRKLGASNRIDAVRIALANNIDAPA